MGRDARDPRHNWNTKGRCSLGADASIMQHSDCPAGTVAPCLDFDDLNGPASRSRFFEGELVVNPIPRSAPRRSAVVTEPAPEVGTTMLRHPAASHRSGRVPLLIRTAVGY